MYRLGLRVNMVQLILYYYSDLVSMYTGIYLTDIIVIDIKVHFSTRVHDSRVILWAIARCFTFINYLSSQQPNNLKGTSIVIFSKLELNLKLHFTLSAIKCLYLLVFPINLVNHLSS